MNDSNKKYLLSTTYTKEKKASFALPGYQPIFPSSFLAFTSGASGNICFQSLQVLWKKRHCFYPKPKDYSTFYKKECSGIKVVYAGLITASYMFYIKKMQCGDFSFPLYMTRRYLGGYGAGVTAISFLSITELIEEGIKNGWRSINKVHFTQYWHQFFTVCPLIMIQQAGYDHLRMLEDPFLPPSIPLFFCTGFVTGIIAQLSVQPFINYFSSNPSSLKKTIGNCFQTALMMGFCLTVRDVILGRLSLSDYEKRCDRRNKLRCNI